MPPLKEYKQNEYFKQCGKIPGDLYWQGRIVKLGQRKEDVDSDNVAAVDVPQVSPTCMSVRFVFELDWTVGGGCHRVVLYLLRHGLTY